VIPDWKVVLEVDFICKRQIAPTCQSDEGYDTLDYD
jgi:hypothetical protein